MDLYQLFNSSLFFSIVGYVHLEDLVLPDIELKDFDISKEGFMVSFKKT